MIYEEKNTKWYLAGVFLLFTFILFYPLWQIGDRELYWSESSYAAMAMETSYLSPNCQAHGEIIPQAFPLLPWLSAILHNEAGLRMETALRSISVVALMLLSLLVWFSGRHAADIRAGAVATAILISSNIVLEKAVDGYPDMLGVLFLFAGWMFWFRIGAVKGNWNLAWTVSLLCCGMAFYTIGWAGIVFFIIPLVFLHRPLTLWPKLRRPGFYFGLGIILFFICLWALPRITAGHMPFRSLPLRTNYMGNYIEHLFYFPFDVAARFMPWTFFMWAPFCVALQPLDKNPIFSRFLRTIVISLFVLLWLSPFTEPRDIILMAPALAILTGCYYTLVIRRYGDLCLKLLRYCIYVTFPIGLCIIAFYLTPTSWWQQLISRDSSNDILLYLQHLISLERGCDFHDNPKYILIGMSYGIIIVVAGMVLLFAPRKTIPIWSKITMLIGVFVLSFWALPHPYKAQESQKREMAAEILKAITKYGEQPPVIYKGPQDIGLYGECYYLGGKIKKISSLDEIPKDEEIIFLISGEPPLDPSRLWKDILSDSKKMRNEKLSLWRGVKDPKKGGSYDGRKH